MSEDKELKVFEKNETLFDLLRWYNDAQMQLQLDEDPFSELELKDAYWAVEQKVDRISFALSKLKSDEQYFADEIKKLQRAKKALENGTKRLRELLVCALEAHDHDLVGSKSVFKKVKGPGAVNIVNQAEVPAKYQIIEPRFDKKKILEDLKLGIKVPGCELMKNNSVREFKKKG